MEVISQHLGVTVAATIATIVILAALFRKFFVRVVRWYVQAQVHIHQTQSELADGYQDLTTLRIAERDAALAECDKLKLTNRELWRDLRSHVVAVQVRDEINQQSAALIRALKLRMDRHHIDYVDIVEAIQKQFENETNPLH